MLVKFETCDKMCQTRPQSKFTNVLSEFSLKRGTVALRRTVRLGARGLISWVRSIIMNWDLLVQTRGIFEEENEAYKM